MMIAASRRAQTGQGRAAAGTSFAAATLSAVEYAPYDMIEWSKAGRPVPHTYRSAALDAEAGRERGDSGTRGEAIRIEP